MTDQPETIESLKAQLEELRAESTRATKVQAALYKIAEAASSSRDMPHFYAALHALVGELMYAGNFFVALWDEQSDMLSWPYHVDEKDVADTVWQPERRQDDRGATAYVMRTGTSIHGATQYASLLEAGELEVIGTVSEDAIFVPLKEGSRILGALAVQSYTKGIGYTAEDVEVLTFVASHIATALTRARAIEETRQRNAELAIINSVGEAMARTLDVKTMTRIVGDKVLEIFGCDIASILLLDARTNLIHTAYEYDKREGGYRTDYEPFPLGKGLTTKVINSRRPLRLGTNAEGQPLGSFIPPESLQGGSGIVAESWLGVPIVVGENVLGTVIISDYATNSFDEADERLLQTLSTNMGVAIENARRFEAEQERVAELQIINSIQQGLASKLDLQGVIDLVGDKLREVLRTDEVGIRLYDAATDLVHYPYEFEHGTRLTIEAQTPSEVFRAMQQGRKSIFGATVKITELYHMRVLPGTEQSKSLVAVPIISGAGVIGSIQLEDYEHEDAFNDSNIRLLETIAASMGVALENARLFDETQRLLKETEQRAAELAIINSIQQALAAKLDIQGIYDAVGDRVSQIFPRADIGLRIYDPQTGLVHFPYMTERGRRLEIDPLPMQPGVTQHVFQTRAPLLINNNLEERTRELGSTTLPGTEMEKSGLWVPILVGNEARGLVGLLDMDREGAFSESDIRLLTTITNSLSVALENARLFDETQRLLKETELRAAELAIINSVQEGLAAKMEIQSIYDLVGEKIRQTFRADTAYIAVLDESSKVFDFPYYMDSGQRLASPGLPVGRGLTSEVFASRAALLLNSKAEMARHDSVTDAYEDASKDLNQSFLGVPVLLGERVSGVVSVQSHEAHAYSENDMRLLQTLANSMSVALESARLFDETQRLLKVSEQRAAELASINTVSQALVAESDPERMIQLIGEQLMDIFKPDIAYVALLDLESNMIQFPYKYGDDFPAMPYGQGLTSRIIDSEQPLLINRDIGRRAQELGTERLGKEAVSYLGVPILAGGEAIGVISVQSTQLENAFRDDDARLLSTIAANAGAAIQTGRLHSETVRRAREMATLAEIGNDIAASRELEPVLKRIAAHARSIMNVRDIAITVRDDQTGLFRTRVALGKYQEEMLQLEIHPGVGIQGDMLQKGVPEIVNDPEHDPRRVTVPGTPEVEEDPECLMCAPLVSRGEVLGGISVWRLRRDGLFTQSELDFLASVARQTTIAMESARLYLETQRRANEMSALADVGREMSASLDATAILERIAERAQELLQAGSSAVYLMDSGGQTMRAVTALGQSAEAIKAEGIRVGEGIIGTLARQAGAEAVNNVATDPRGLPLPGMKEEVETERMMAAPLMRGEEVVGMLVVWRTTAPFSQADLNFLIGLARQAAIAYENARLFDEVKRQGAYLETIFLNSPVAIVTVDDNDRIMSWSPAAEKLFGYSSAEAVGQNVDRLVANAEAVRQEAVSYTEQGKHNQYVHRVTRRTRKDGSLVDVDLSALPLPLEGGKTGVVAIYNDVGEIQRQRKYYEAIVQNSPVAIVTVDQDSRVVSWNPGAEQLFGYPKDEAIGRNVDDMVAATAETHSEADAYNQQARAEELHVITKRTRKDGSLVDVELSGVPLPLPTGESGLVAIYHDITELQRARHEAVAANEAKSAFLATMSHEIRTPMNAVIGMSGLLMDTPLNPEQRDYAETIRNSGDALLTIINDILDFSKIEAGKMELESQPFDLRECVESAMDLVATRANEKNLDLAYIIEDDVPAGVRGDVTRLRQILLNLASNAVKFTEKGEVVLTVKQDQEPGRLLFAVRDSGIGIPKNRMGRLFASFSQADSSTTRRFGGTGLGLAISKRLAEMMGGTMWVESAGPGKGSTFSFTMQAPAVRVTTRKTVRELNGVQPSLSDKRVLIVDDNATNRRILALQTGKWGMTPRETESPLEALRLLKSDAPFDLAILDVQMPEMDGVSLAREVRKLKSREHLPVILLTSLGRREAGAEDLRIAAFLTKPLKPSGLFDALAGIFARKIAAPKADAAKAVIDSGFAAAHPLRILLAEDNAVNQKLALRLLEQMGYRADVASNGIEAVESVERQAYDVVLMDVQMPEMDGLDSTRTIRKLTSIRQPRVIAMTANAMQGDREMCLAAGMDDYVSKPIRVAELMEALRRTSGLASKTPPRARQPRRVATRNKAKKARRTASSKKTRPDAPRRPTRAKKR